MAKNTARTANYRPGVGLLSLGAAALAVGAGIAAYLTRRATPAAGGHDADDLIRQTRPGPDDRAPLDFRPDAQAPVAAADREAFRPATLAVPFPNDITVERVPSR